MPVDSQELALSLEAPAPRFTQAPDEEIALGPDELYCAATLGLRRGIDDIFGGLTDRYGCPPQERWQRNIEGTLAEYAFAKLIGLAPLWLGTKGNLGDLRADDVGGYQVRGTRYEKGRLIVHKADPDARIFVLVTGFDARYRARGWIEGRVAKAIGLWESPPGINRPAYWVWQHDLGAMIDLPGILPTATKEAT